MDKYIVRINKVTTPAIIYVMAVDESGFSKLEVYEEGDIDLTEKDENGSPVYQTID